MSYSHPLESDTFYHIYNRGINGDTIFLEQRNYSYFLLKYSQYLHPAVETYAYCLMANHFHLLIKVRDQFILNQIFRTENKGKTNIPKTGLHSESFIVNRLFARFFKSITQAINKTNNRTGSLLESPFKRITVENEEYVTQLIWYIHNNPKKHGFVNDFKKYPHSSYHSILSSKSTRLEREKVIDWFRNRDNFINFHEVQNESLNLLKLPSNYKDLNIF